MRVCVVSVISLCSKKCEFNTEVIFFIFSFSLFFLIMRLNEMQILFKLAWCDCDLRILVSIQFNWNQFIS